MWGVRRRKNGWERWWRGHGERRENEKKCKRKRDDKGDVGWGVSLEKEMAEYDSVSMRK
jgi:hypothetical protein